MLRRLSTIAVCALAALAPQMGNAFRAQGGMMVNPVDAVVFEVVSRAGSNGQEYWCAAASYALRELDAQWGDVIYIARKRGVSVTTGRKSAVQFTLDAEAAGITPVKPSLSINWLKLGEHMNVQEANSFCENTREIL